MKEERDLFSELTEGFGALAEQRAAKRTLRAPLLSARPKARKQVPGNAAGRKPRGGRE